MLGVVVACTALIAGGSFWAGSQVSAPQHSLPARVVEPVPTALVRHGRMVDALAVPGAVARGRELPVRPLPSVAGGGDAIVTKLPVGPRSRLVEGSVAAEVSGQPTIVLFGTIPMYRDLTQGSIGEDVAQFQAALVRLGYRVTDPVGRFGDATAAAALALFGARGYPPQLLEPAPAEDSPDTAARGRRSRRAHAPAVTVPAGSIVYLQRLPASVSRVSARVGQTLQGPLLFVAAGAPVVHASVDPSQLGSVRRGMAATITVGARRLRGHVAGVPPVRASGGDAGAAAVTIAVDAVSRSLRVRRPVAVRIELGRSRGRVLSVPFSAVSTGADGSDTVRVRTADGGWRRVRVALGFGANGYVAVRPRGGGELAAGERVAVAG